MKIFQKIFALLYDWGMKNKEKNLFSQRRLSLISELQGSILEIGSGTGINFQYYNDKAIVTAIEPSEYMCNAGRKKIHYKNITIVQHTIQEAIDTNILSPEGYDHIVCTLVLCSVPHYKNCINTIITLLKPGGTLIIMEHVTSKNRGIAFLQTLFTPLQKCIADGCHLNRKTDIFLKGTSLSLSKEEYFGRRSIFYRAIFIK